MANKEVNLTKRIKTDEGLRFCPVVLSANGAIVYFFRCGILPKAGITGVRKRHERLPP